MTLLILAWLLFFVAHSAFAATPIRLFFEQKMTPQSYRLLYNFQSLLFIGLVIYALLYGDKTMVFKCNIILCFIGSTLIFIGLYIMNAAFKHINKAAFLGFSIPKEESKGLNTEGVYAVVRHPLYWGISVALIGLFLFMPFYSILISTILSIIYMAIGIEFEEKKLRTTFGKEYEDYAVGKKKFLPYVY